MTAFSPLRTTVPSFIGRPPGVAQARRGAPPTGGGRRQPGVDLGQRLRPQRVDPPLGVLADVDQPGLAQHAQVLRRPGLRQARRGDQMPDRPRLVAQEVEDLPPARLGQHLDRGVPHAAYILRRLYACEGMKVARQLSPGAGELRRNLWFSSGRP